MQLGWPSGLNRVGRSTDDHRAALGVVGVALVAAADGLSQQRIATPTARNETRCEVGRELDLGHLGEAVEEDAVRGPRGVVASTTIRSSLRTT